MRAVLVAALVLRPSMLFPDKPTIGLDAVSNFALRNALDVINRGHGTTIVLTTHDLGVVEKLGERAVIIDHGLIPDQPLAAHLDDVGFKCRSRGTGPTDLPRPPAPRKHRLR